SSISEAVRRSLLRRMIPARANLPSAPAVAFANTLRLPNKPSVMRSVGHAVLSEIDNSVCNRRARRGRLDVLAADTCRYLRSLLEASERPGEACAAGAEHPRETQDLAGPDGEILSAPARRCARLKQQRGGSSDLRQLEPLTHAVSDNETDQ